MADITVIHNNLNKKGGGEKVCMTILEALQDEHDLTLLLSTDVEEFNSLNEYFNTNIEDIDIEVMTVAGQDLLPILERVSAFNVWKFGYFTKALRHALFNRYCLQSIESTDLIISTWDEVSTKQNSVQYIHWPNRYKNLVLTESLSYGQGVVSAVKLFNFICRKLGKFSKEDITEARLVCNSDRTASQVKLWYGVRPQVLNPPIDTAGLSGGHSWEDREDGIIFLSRIHPGKNIEWLIEILYQVRQRGHDIHFHVIGPKDTDHPEYYQKIQSLSNEHDFVTLEGQMQGEALNRMLREHKYGINGSRTEQFGIAIAEMIAAGMIPFVPNSGGQRELVKENPAVMFDTTEEAVEKIAKIHSDSHLAAETRQSFPDIEKEYGKKVFKKEIQQIVDEQLDSINES